MTESEPTLRDVFEFFHERHERSAENFDGELPEQGVSAIVKNAQMFDEIQMKSDIYRSDESIDTDGLDEEEALDMEAQAIDMLGALALLETEYDLDIAERFRTMKARTEAIEQADSMEELQEAMQEAGLDMEFVEPGVEAGDNVDMDDYEPEGRDRGTY